MALLDPQRSYTFSEIAKLKAPTDDVLAEYGYSLERTLLNLPQFQGKLDRLDSICFYWNYLAIWRAAPTS